MKYLKFLLCLVIFHANLYAEQSPEVFLMTFWDMAEKNSPGLKARMKQLESIDHSLNALPEWYKPNVYVESGYTGAYNPQTNAHGPLARFVAEWNLWDGGRTEYTKLAGQKKAEVAKWKQTLLTMDLKKSIARVYFEAASLEELKIQNANKLQHLSRLSRLMQPRLKIGQIGYSDLEDVRIRMTQLKNNQKALDSILPLKKQQLNILIGLDQKNDLTIPPLSKQAVFNSDPLQLKMEFSTLPSYKLGQASLKVLEAELELSRRNLYWPSFSIETYGGYGPHVDAIDTTKPEVGLGFKFKIPLYSSRDRSSTMAAQKSVIDAARLDLEQSLLEAKIEFNQKTGMLGNQKIQLKNLEATIQKTIQNLNLAYREFSRGLKSPTDMLSSIETLFDAKKDYIHMQSQWQTLGMEFYLLKVYAAEKKEKTTGKDVNK